MRHPRGEPKRLDRLHRFPTPDDGRRATRCERPGDRVGAGGERRILEAAERAVPEHRAGPYDRRRVARARFRADVEDAILGPDQVRRQQDLDPALLRRGEDRPGLVLVIRLRERALDVGPDRGEEGIRHSAADRDDVGFRQERLKHANLRAHLRATDDRKERPLGRGKEAGEHADLGLEEQAGVRRQNVRDPLGRRVRTMRRAEGVVHVRVERGGEGLRERRIVALLLGMEADILQQERLAEGRGADLLGDLVADAVRGEGDAVSEELREALGDRRKAERIVGALRAAQMRADPDHRPAVQERAHRGKRRADARVVRDAAVLDRDVQVRAEEHALPRRIEVGDRALGHGDQAGAAAGCLSLEPTNAVMSASRQAYPHSLSYQLTIFTMLPRTIVSMPLTIVE